MVDFSISSSSLTRGVIVSSSHTPPQCPHCNCTLFSLLSLWRAVASFHLSLISACVLCGFFITFYSLHPGIAGGVLPLKLHDGCAFGHLAHRFVVFDLRMVSVPQLLRDGSISTASCVLSAKTNAPVGRELHGPVVRALAMFEVRSPRHAPSALPCRLVRGHATGGVPLARHLQQSSKSPHFSIVRLDSKPSARLRNQLTPSTGRPKTWSRRNILYRYLKAPRRLREDEKPATRVLTNHLWTLVWAVELQRLPT